LPKFEYKAIDPNGREVSGAVEAGTTQEAISKIKNKGLYPTQMNELTKEQTKEETTATAAAPEAPGKKGGLNKEISIPFLGIGTVKNDDIAIFTRQLATLIEAGLPLVRSLNVLHEQLKTGPLKDILSNLSKEVSSGGTLSEAMSKYPNVFTSLYVNMIKAGEAGGVLEIVLERLAEFQEKNMALTRKVKSALTYPALVVIFSVIVLLFLTTFIIPKFMGIFENMNIGEMPKVTKFVMAMSSLMRDKWYIGIGLIVILIVGIKILNSFKNSKFFVDKFKLHLPVAGELIRKMEVARFSRTLGTLISSGVPILQALRITRGTMNNEVMSRALKRVHDSIREGESIAGPLKASGTFPLMVVNMIDVGEETGSLDTMLNKVADIYETEVDTTVNALTSILEPFLIVGMGIIVGFLVISMFMPLFKLMTSITMQR
jgi:type IV pilus assembly protein PilC